MLYRMLAVLLILTGGSTSVHATPAAVVSVYDGDTLEVSMQAQKVMIRLYGIDAPESGQHGNVSAKRFLQHLVNDHPLMIKVIETDLFDRTLAIVIREGKESSVNAAMVANGYAWVDPQHCRVDACGAWMKLESQARRLKLGIWSDYNLVPPWEFRKQQHK